MILTSYVSSSPEVLRNHQYSVHLTSPAPACISPHSDNNPSVPESFLPSDTGTYCPAHRQKPAQAL